MSTTVTPLTPSQVNFAQTSQWIEIIHQYLKDLRVAIPAIVQSFNAEEQTVTAQIAIKETVRTQTGPQDMAIGILTDLPVVLPRSGGFCVTLPLQQGDECLLVFGDMCIDSWWQSGGIQSQFERRRHDLSDAFCIPILGSQPRVLSNYSTESLQVRSDDGTVILDVAESGITMTAPAITINATGDVKILGEQVLITSSANDTAIDNKVFLGHIHSGVETGGSDTGPVVA